MYLVINKCETAVKVSNFSGHYLRNRSTLDIGVLGYIGTRNTLPKFCPFLLGHTVYDIEKGITVTQINMKEAGSPHQVTNASTVQVVTT